MINGFEDFNEVEVVVEKSKGKEVSLTSPKKFINCSRAEGWCWAYWIIEWIEEISKIWKKQQKKNIKEIHWKVVY